MADFYKCIKNACLSTPEIPNTLSMHAFNRPHLLPRKMSGMAGMSSQTTGRVGFCISKAFYDRAIPLFCLFF